MGHPITAQTFRARAAYLRNQNAGQPPQYQFDDNLPPNTKVLAGIYLQQEARPEVIEQVAADFERMGYPITAQTFRAHAAYLRAQQQGTPPPQQPPWVQPYPQPYPQPPDMPYLPGDDSPPVIVWDPNNSNAQPQGGGALVPMLAFLGAGLAFS
ncbi:hypothetical protein [Polyangium aurulentum]|uniref:hypothetical protein n=1 Tax=Polyangium aurulentum TaxID=2567896 RepID=UPI0010AEEAD5|nr:hypothetical protein [Polyangium aurulentum]UQA60404.1 hypothetical protein E8A73_007995 [Polyangium aurulentum]